MTFGDRVRQLRKRQGINQRTLAERVGIDFSYISKIENSRMEPPREEVVRHMALALEANVDELIVLAGKFPSDLAQELKTLEIVEALRRIIAGDHNSLEDLQKAFRNRGK